MLVVQFGDFGLIGLEMVRQHVVDVAEQRHFVLADDPQDKLYPLVVLLADIDRFADACGDGRLFQKQRAVIRLPAFGFTAARFFPLYRLRYKNKNGCVIYYLRTASKTEVSENACSTFANMICYRQSRNILLNRIGHGAFGYSLRFSHFYGDAILNYLLEFFFA